MRRASCVAQIARLLPLIAKATGHSIHSGDKTILESYTPLRHHFEHLNERAPGKVRDEEIFAEHQSDHHWGFKIGFESDEFDRIILYGQPIDVTTRGLRVIEALMQRAYEGFKAGCLERVEQHFIKHPEDIPAPCDVPYHPFVSIADEKL